MNYHDLSLSLARALIAAESKPGHDTSASEARPEFTLTISREAGALGNSVANEVGRRLGWPVYDRNILDKIAEELRRPPSHLESLDERPMNWLGECLSCLFDKYHVGTDAYLKHLFTAVRGLGAVGKCVIVGRGANFLLPTETTLRVRLVSQPEDRARAVAERLAMTPDQAADWVAKTEAERLRFIKRAYNEDPRDAHHYDLVLNTSRLSVEEAVDIILETLKRLERHGRPEEKRAATVVVA